MRRVVFQDSEAGRHLREGVRTGFVFAWLDPKTLEALHPSVQCKDYLHDVFWGEATGHPVHCYGFVWKPGSMPAPQHGRYALGVYWNGETLSELAEKSAALLHYWENVLGFPSTGVELCNDGKALLFNPARVWVSKPLYISLYTLMIRVSPALGKENPRTFLQDQMSKHAQGSSKLPCGYDLGYIAHGRDNLSALMSGLHPVQSWTDFGDSVRVHSYSGVAYWKGKFE